MIAREQSEFGLLDPPALAGPVDESGPAWLGETRAAALDRFSTLGLPTARNEEWRFTSLKPIISARFRAGADDRAVHDLERFDILSLRCPRAVFVNGRFSAEASPTGDVPDGVSVMTLSEANESHGDLVREHLCMYADFEDEAFTALNTALFHDAAVVRVAKGVAVESPIHVLSVTTAPIVTHPRLLVVAEEGAQVTVIEDHAGSEGGVYLTNAVTEIVVGPNAGVVHYFLERESESAYNISTLKVKQDRDSRFTSHSVLLGGAIVRNNVNPVLDGENAHSVLNGLYLPRGEQHMDNHMRVVHAKPNCDSRQYYRGVMSDESRGVFSGRIVVAQDAQKTDAVQSNANLLLSDRARAHAKPQLEIYADDVKCTHGATVGELDEEAVFYLRSRGMSEDAARGMLISSFARESLERMELAPLRDALTELVLKRFPQTRALNEGSTAAGGSTRHALQQEL